MRLHLPNTSATLARSLLLPTFNFNFYRFGHRPAAPLSDCSRGIVGGGNNNCRWWDAVVSGDG
eukprot:scaffold12312_cov248-Ochromonas_danica.AAC.9